MNQAEENYGNEILSLIKITAGDKDKSKIDSIFQLENIKSADPYDNDPYDRVIQVSYIFKDLCDAFIEIGVFSPKELNTIVTTKKIVEIIDENKRNPAISELGIYNTFSFSKKCALEISKNIKNIIEKFKPEIFKCRREDPSSKNPPSWNIMLLDYHFYALRYVYINLGKLHALYFYFANQEQLKDKEQKTNSSTTEYIFDVKDILLNLLADQSKKQKTKFKTIPSATKGILDKFTKEYEDIQQNKTYVNYQKFFDVKNLDRNIRLWKNSDPDFKRKLSEFIS